MRLVAWNANYNCRKQPLEETVALLAPLQADILVLSEVAPPSTEGDRGAHWVGAGSPGLAVLAPDLDLVAHPANVSAPPFMCGFDVRGRLEFSLLAVWPVKREQFRSYHKILTAGLNAYESLLGARRAIMAGDFNSNTRVVDQQTSHPQFVKAADSLGLVSAYHAQSGEAHGQETVPTYMHAPEASFHLDYCFVSKQLAASANVCVLRGGDWPKRSDHFPVVMDIPDALMR